MEIIKDKEFGGERPLFASQGIKLENVTVHAGESALKCCRNIVASHCRFEGKYPFWQAVSSLLERVPHCGIRQGYA